MAKKREEPKPTPPEPTPGFVPDGPAREATGFVRDEPEDDIGDDTEPTPDPRDAELAALRAENERLRASAGPVYAAGKRYQVSLKDGPTAVVECGPTEHPYEAYRRLTGVLGSTNTPEIRDAPDDAPLGIVRPGA